MAGSPLDFDFDFTNLIISGKVSGTFQAENDLYSDWKEIVIADSTGQAAGAPPAFLESNARVAGGRAGGSVGGNPIGGSQQIAPYFFLNNIDGWRLRPPEEDGETSIEGNLFPLDPDTPFVIPTVGTFTQLLRLVVSPQAIVDTVDAGLTVEESLQLTRIHDQVEREIYVDTDIGSPDGDGSQQAPFNTFAAAASLAESIGIRNIAIMGDSTLDRALPKFSFRGVGNPILSLAGNNVNQSHFSHLTLSGIQNGTIEADLCSLANNMTGLDGQYRGCGLLGDLTIANNGKVIMSDPFSEIPGLGRPTIDLGGGPSTLALRRYSGGLTVEGMTHASNEVTIELAAGKITLDSSCVTGDFTLRGVGQFTDSSAGTTVDVSGFILADDITFIKGLVGGDAVVSLDDLTVTIYNNDVSPRQVLAVYSISADERVRTRTA